MRLIKNYLSFINENFIPANGVFDSEWESEISRDYIINDLLLGESDYNIKRQYAYYINGELFFEENPLPEIKMFLCTHIEIPVYDNFEYINTVYNFISEEHPNILTYISHYDGYDKIDITDFNEDDYMNDESFDFVYIHEKHFTATMEEVIEEWYEGEIEEDEYVKIDNEYFYITTLDEIMINLKHYLFKDYQENKVMNAIEKMEHKIHEDKYYFKIEPYWFINQIVESIEEIFIKALKSLM